MGSVAVKVGPGRVTGNEPWIKAIADRESEKVLRAAKKLAPRKTGTLANSGQRRVLRRGRGWIGQVTFTAKHASWVHDGTGLYGPRRQLIYPKRAKVLRWTDDGGVVHYARWVRGMHARPFLRDALAVIGDKGRIAVSGYTTARGTRVAPVLRRRSAR